MDGSPVKSADSLRSDLIFVISQVQNHAQTERAQAAALSRDLTNYISTLELELAETAVSAVFLRSPDEAIRRRCDAALRAIYLRHTRTTAALNEAAFLGILRNFRVIPVLLNDAEAIQAFRAKATAAASLQQFLDVISVCSLAFARPPHNAKPATCEIHLWRFLGLTDGSWRKHL
jgi:hypothetical protein